MLEAGRYVGNVIGAKAGKSQKGTPYLLVEFLLTHAAVNGQWVDTAPDTKRGLYIYLNANTMTMAKKKLASLGFNGAFGNPAFTKGDRVQLDLIHDDSYDGKPREKWELADWGGREVDPLGGDMIQHLDTIWKDEAPTGSDIPFN